MLRQFVLSDVDFFAIFLQFGMLALYFLRLLRVLSLLVIDLFVCSDFLEGFDFFSGEHFSMMALA